jgi:pentatricopeptide repeat protein
MYLSLQSRALVNAHLKEGNTEKANEIVNEWHSDTSPQYDKIVIAQRKLKEELEQLKRVKNNEFIRS